MADELNGHLLELRFSLCDVDLAVVLRVTEEVIDQLRADTACFRIRDNEQNRQDCTAYTQRCAASEACTTAPESWNRLEVPGRAFLNRQSGDSFQASISGFQVPSTCSPASIPVPFVACRHTLRDRTL